MPTFEQTYDIEPHLISLNSKQYNHLKLGTQTYVFCFELYIRFIGDENIRDIAVPCIFNR